MHRCLLLKRINGVVDDYIQSMAYDKQLLRKSRNRVLPLEMYDTKYWIGITGFVDSVVLQNADCDGIGGMSAAISAAKVNAVLCNPTEARLTSTASLNDNKVNGSASNSGSGPIKYYTSGGIPASTSLVRRNRKRAMVQSFFTGDSNMSTSSPSPVTEVSHTVSAPPANRQPQHGDIRISTIKVSQDAIYEEREIEHRELLSFIARKTHENSGLHKGEKGLSPFTSEGQQHFGEVSDVMHGKKFGDMKVSVFEIEENHPEGRWVNVANVPEAVLHMRSLHYKNETERERIHQKLSVAFNGRSAFLTCDNTSVGLSPLAQVQTSTHLRYLYSLKSVRDTERYLIREPNEDSNLP